MDYDISKEYIQIIKSKIKLGEYKSAILSANKLIEFDPELPIAYYLRGLCRYAQNDFLRSIEDYGFATAFDPNFAKAYFNMGVAKYQMKFKIDAIEDIKRAQRIFSKQNDQHAIRKCVESIDLIIQEGS